MPRGKKQSAESVLANALALLQANNVDTTGMKDYVETNFRNTEAVATLAHQPEIFQHNQCRECGKPFAHSQKIPHGTRVAFCSTGCARDNWKKTTGLDYKRISTRDVWEGDPPLIINPDQYEALRRITAWFSRNQVEIKNTLAQGTTEAYLESQRTQTEAYHLEDSDPHYPEPPIQVESETPQPASEFDIFSTQHTDQDDVQTNHDSWIFG